MRLAIIDTCTFGHPAVGFTPATVAVVVSSETH